MTRTVVPLAVFCCASAVAVADASVKHAQLADVEIGTPSEGRWSIASGWENGWPAKWTHAQPDRSIKVGDWTIHHGHITLPMGTWRLQDSVRSLGDGLIECRRRWHWTGDVPLDRITLSARWQLRADNARPFLPSISYYDNPAGQSVDAARIPVIGSEEGCKGFYEEHRFSMPLAAVEASLDDRLFGAALHSVPSPLRAGNYDDQWWSLGIEYIEDGVELALLSGAVSSNGNSGVIKAQQRSFVPYGEAYLNIPPGTIIDKRFFIQLYPVAERGHGFRPALWQSIQLFEPFDFSGFPPLAEIIRLKFLDTTNRWHEDDQFAGIDAFPDTGGTLRPWIDLGWAGQSEAAAYPLILLGRRFGIENADHMAQRSIDFISSSPFHDDGFAIRYDFHAHRWFPRTNPLSQAQAMNNLLNALRVARQTNRFDVQRWEHFLREACDWHKTRVLSASWHPKSTNEGFLIAPLAQAATLLKDDDYLRAARKAADHYGKRHLTMDEPYWGGTLDARCEDKEGAWAALQGFLAMYDATKQRKYLDWATHAADVVISYVYTWDVPLPPGRLADHAFKSRGWTSVSVQNMHLDVYGALCAPAIWRIGDLTGHDEYRQIARLMLVACGQLVDAEGGQGEQLHQTNYAQHYDVTELDGVRGDYVESWNVYWISAHFLTAAAQLEEMGVEWMKW